MPLDELSQSLKPIASCGRNEEAVRFTGADGLDGFEATSIDLIRHNTAKSLAVKGVQQLVHGGELSLPVRIGEIHDKQKQISIERFLQRGAEGFEQRGWQITDESDGVGEKNPLGRSVPCRKVKFAGGGIEGGEQLVFRQDSVAFPTTAERIQQT